MRHRTAFIMVSVSLLLAVGGASAQDPDNAYIPDIRTGVYPEDTILTLRGKVVTALFPFGIWVQEPTATSFQRSGIWCYTTSTPDVTVGTLVDVKGNYEEYFELSEINVPAGNGFVRRVGLGTAPEPAVVNPSDVRNGSPTGEDWEGVLVKIEDVECTWHNPSYGQYTLTRVGAPGDTVIADDRALNPPPRPPVGSVFHSVTGIMDFNYSERKIQPRGNDDFDWASGEPAPGVEVAYSTSNTEVGVRFDRNVDPVTASDPLNYFFNNLGEFPATAARDPDEHDLVHLTVSTPFTPNNPVPEILDVSGVENEGGTPMVGTVSVSFIAGLSTIDFVQTSTSGSGSQVEGEIVTVKGIVTAGTRHDFIGSAAYQYYIEMPGGGPRSGIFVYDRRVVDRGEELLIAAQVDEYSGMTELYIPSYHEVLSTGNSVPGPDLVPMSSFPDTLTAEPWEAVLIRVENVVVAQDTAMTGFGEWTVRSDTDTLRVGDDCFYSYNPQIGDPISYLVGPLEYAFGEFMLQPRGPFDIGSPNGVGVGDAGAPGAPSELRGGAPNPFNPQTGIRLVIREEVPVSLSIYDPNGRLVRTLLAGELLPAGEHSVPWDGRSDSGHSVASGTYVVRFEAGAIESTQKITLLK